MKIGSVATRLNSEVAEAALVSAVNVRGESGLAKVRTDLAELVTRMKSLEDVDRETTFNAFMDRMSLMDKKRDAMEQKLEALGQRMDEVNELRSTEEDDVELRQNCHKLVEQAYKKMEEAQRDIHLEITDAVKEWDAKVAGIQVQSQWECTRMKKSIEELKSQVQAGGVERQGSPPVVGHLSEVPAEIASHQRMLEELRLKVLALGADMRARVECERRFTEEFARLDSGPPWERVVEEAAVKVNSVVMSTGTPDRKAMTEAEKKVIAKEATKQRRKASRKANRALKRAGNLPERVAEAAAKISAKTVQQPEKKKKKKDWYKKKDKGAGLVNVNSVEVDAIVDRGVKKWKEAFLEGMELAARRDGRQDSTR